jgi:hypothetical protein
MKPGASFAFGSLNFAVGDVAHQDDEISRQDGPMDTSSTNQVSNQAPDGLPGDDQMDASFENSEQRCLRRKLGLTWEGLDEDEVAKPQEDIDEDALHHLIPTSLHEDSDSSGQPRFVFQVGDDPGASNVNPGTTYLLRDGATASPSAEDDEARWLRLEVEVAAAAQAQHGTQDPRPGPSDHNRRHHQHHVSPTTRRRGANLRRQIDEMQVDGTTIYATP